MAKSKYEKLLSKLPAHERKGRRTIANNVSYDFNKQRYYYLLGKDENRNNKYKSFKDPHDLELFVKDFEKTGNKKQSYYFTKTTTEEYLSQFLEKHTEQLTLATRKYYNSAFKRVCNNTFGIGDKCFSDVNVDDIKNYLTERQKVSSIATTKKDYEFLKMAFNQAVIERKLSYNPVPAAKINFGNHAQEKLKAKNNIAFYNVDEYRQIIKICMGNLTKDNKFHNEDPNNIYSWATVIALDTGMRRAEVLGLKFSDIKTLPNGKRYFALKESRTIECKNAATSLLKTTESERACVFTDTLEVLISYIEKRYKEDRKKENYTDNGFIIAYSNGDIPNPSSFTKGYKKFLAENGISKVLDFKDLRHTFATILNSTGVITPVVLKELMGHTRFSTTENYYIGKKMRITLDHTTVFSEIMKKADN